MPSVGFEPTISAFERANTVHALVCAASVIGTPEDGIVNIETCQIRDDFKSQFQKLMV
jgi:hypothetical protein